MSGGVGGLTGTCPEAGPEKDKPGLRRRRARLPPGRSSQARISDTGPPSTPPRPRGLLSGSLAPARAPGAWPRALANDEARRVKLRDGRHR